MARRKLSNGNFFFLSGQTNRNGVGKTLEACQTGIKMMVVEGGREIGWSNNGALGGYSVFWVKEDGKEEMYWERNNKK